MHFASLTSLWFALALPLIIIMYLLKKKYDDTTVSSHMLWQLVLKNMEANRPWQKLRNHLLLYLQLLMAAVLVLALMQPYIWASATAKDHVIVVIDQSASMAAQVLPEDGNDEQLADNDRASGSRFNLAIEKITASLKTDARGKMVTLIGIGQQANMITVRETDHQLIEAALASMTIHYGRTAYEEALSLAAQLAQDEQAQVHLYTDGQFTTSLETFTWSSPPIVHHIGHDQTNNASILQFGVKRDGPASDKVSAVAAFKNWGDETLNFQAILQTDDGYRHEQTISLMPQEQKTVFIDDQPLGMYYQLVIQVDDLLLVDNEAFAFLTDDRAKRALLLTSGSMFLEKAMQLSGIEILKSQMDADGKMVLPHTEVDMIVIDRITPDALDTEQWQQFIASKPVWYLRYALADYELIQPKSLYTMTDHPILTYIELRNMPLAEVQLFEDLGWGEAIAYVDDTPLIYAGHVNGMPRVAYTFDLHRTDLPLRPEFPVLVNNTIQWLTSAQAQNLGMAAADELLELSLMTSTQHASWQSLSNDAEVYPAELIEGEVSHLQTTPSIPGLYAFIEQDGQGNTVQSRLLNVVMEQRESNLALASETFNDAWGDDDREPTGGRLGETQLVKRSFIPWLIMIIFVLVIFEWEVYRRGASI